MSSRDTIRKTISALSSILALNFIGACTYEIPENGQDRVAGTLTLPDSPYRVEFKIFQMPEGLRHFNHVTYGLALGKDGFLYIGISDNDKDGRLLRYDIRSEEILDLGGFLDAIPPGDLVDQNYGKFHVQPFQAEDGAIYFASYTREYWPGEQSGRLFRYRESSGIVDLGPLPDNQGAYFMHGDDRYQRLYFADHLSRFLIYDIASGEWEVKESFSTKPPFIGLTDRLGRLYMYSHDGEKHFDPGPATITRYDPASNTLETSSNSPPALWVGALTPDHEIAFTTGYNRGELYRWSLSDWPDYETEHLGRIDPRGRPVFSNNLSLTSDQENLVVAGTITSRNSWYMGNLHGVWAYHRATGTKMMLAELNEALSESFGMDAGDVEMYWNNMNTVDDNGWIYIGVHILPSDSRSRARLLALRILPNEDG